MIQFSNNKCIPILSHKNVPMGVGFTRVNAARILKLMIQKKNKLKYKTN